MPNVPFLSHSVDYPLKALQPVHGIKAMKPFRNVIRKVRVVATILKMHRFFTELITRYLYFLENQNKHFWGSLSDEEELELAELTTIASSLPGPIIELGALFGFTTQLLVSHKPRDKQLIAVENFSWNPFLIPPAHHRTITYRVLRYSLINCSTSLFDGNTDTFYRTYGGDRPSLVFIDADHTFEAAQQDIGWAVRVGARIVCGHDYCESCPGVVQAVHEAFGRHNITVVGTLWHHVSS